jgi:hypothetical protein
MYCAIDETSSWFSAASVKTQAGLFTHEREPCSYFLLIISYRRKG